MAYGKKAFSLVELLVVMAIAGILASIAVPSYRSYRNRAQMTEVYQRIAELTKKWTLRSETTGWVGWGVGDGPQDITGMPYLSQIYMSPSVIVLQFNPGYFNREATTYVTYRPELDGRVVGIDISEYTMFAALDAAKTIGWYCDVSGPPGQYYGGYNLEDFQKVYFPDCA